MILLKNPSRFFSFFQFGVLADEPEFVTIVDFPLHHFTWFDIDGGCQRQRQVDVALRDGLFAADGLNFGRIVHICSLVN